MVMDGSIGLHLFISDLFLLLIIGTWTNKLTS